MAPRTIRQCCPGLGNLKFFFVFRGFLEGSLVAHPLCTVRRIGHLVFDPHVPDDVREIDEFFRVLVDRIDPDSGAAVWQVIGFVDGVGMRSSGGPRRRSCCWPAS